MSLNTDYVTVLALVITLEVPLAWFRGLGATPFVWQREGLLRIGLLVVLANAMVHPLCFFGFMASGLPYLWATLGGQACTVMAKTLIFRQSTGIRVWQAFTIAFWCTFISWQVAPLLIFWAYN